MNCADVESFNVNERSVDWSFAVRAFTIFTNLASSIVHQPFFFFIVQFLPFWGSFDFCLLSVIMSFFAIPTRSSVYSTQHLPASCSFTFGGDITRDNDDVFAPDESNSTQLPSTPAQLSPAQTRKRNRKEFGSGKRSEAKKTKGTDRRKPVGINRVWL